jgi:hypothetical protein
MGTIWAERSADFLAGLHPLHRRFLAYRGGLVDGQRHSVDEAAQHFGIDPATARLTDEYVQARLRVHVERTGWRAAQTSTW